MAVFDLEKTEGVWFDYPGGGRIKLKAATPSDMYRIHKTTTEFKPFLFEKEGQFPKVLNQEIPDPDKHMKAFNDICIMDWEEFVDKNGKDIPCTLEMKTELMRLNDPEFRDFVAEKLKLLDAAETGKQEGEKKT